MGGKHYENKRKHKENYNMAIACVMLIAMAPFTVSAADGE